VTGSEATTKHKVTLDPICTPPAREASLDGQARCLTLGSRCWWVGRCWWVCWQGYRSGSNARRRKLALSFLVVLDFIYFIFPLIYRRARLGV